MTTTLKNINKAGHLIEEEGIMFVLEEQVNLVREKLLDEGFEEVTGKTQVIREKQFCVEPAGIGYYFWGYELISLEQKIINLALGKMNLKKQERISQTK